MAKWARSCILAIISVALISTFRLVCSATGDTINKNKQAESAGALPQSLEESNAVPDHLWDEDAVESDDEALIPLLPEPNRFQKPKSIKRY